MDIVGGGLCPWTTSTEHGSAAVLPVLPWQLMQPAHISVCIGGQVMRLPRRDLTEGQLTHTRAAGVG